MTGRTSIALPDSLASDLKAHKREDQTWPAFVREDVLPALEGDTDVFETIDDLEATVEELETTIPERTVDELKEIRWQSGEPPADDERSTE